MGPRARLPRATRTIPILKRPVYVILRARAHRRGSRAAPSTRARSIGDLDAHDPLHALVAELLRHHQAQRPAVPRRKRRAVQGVGEDGVRRHHDLQGKTAQVPTTRVTDGVEGGVPGLGPQTGLLQQRGRRHATPPHVVGGPAGDAVEVGRLGEPPQGRPRRAVDGERALDQPVHRQDPVLGRHVRRRFDAEYREVAPGRPRRSRFRATRPDRRVRGARRPWPRRRPPPRRPR